MNSEVIKISIMEDHQGIIDGYFLRLKDERIFNIIGQAHFGNELEPMLEANRCDLLILDIDVPTSAYDHNMFPIIPAIPRLMKKYPGMKILVISMHSHIVLIEKLVDLGVSGYIFKSDSAAIMKLDRIILSLANGANYFSQGIFSKLRLLKTNSNSSLLSPRQVEVLSLCSEFPDCDTHELAIRLGVTDSTFRNTLSGAYDKLGVHTRQAAVNMFLKIGMNFGNSSDNLIEADLSWIR